MIVPFAEGQGWPAYGEDEIEAVAETLRSGRVNQWTGDKVKRFEQAFAARFDMPHAIALANGSVALELALLSLGIGPGDEVIVTPRSFVASSSCVSLVGATPVFADVDLNSQNITAETISVRITPRTKAIIPVHLAGWPCEMTAIMALSDEHGLKVIEDCAQSPGAEIDGKLVGSFGHAAAHSFCQDKIITTGGEGGMVLFRDPQAFEHAWSFKDHGKNRRITLGPSAGPGFRYVHDIVGTNWRMTEIQAAIGLIQLQKLNGWLTRRAENAAIFRKAVVNCPTLRIPWPPDGVRHAWYKFYAFLVPHRLKSGVTRDTVLKALVEGGIRVFSGSCPEIYREKAFADLAMPDCPNAAALGETSLMIEIHPTLDQRDLADTASRVAQIVMEHSQ